MEQWIIEYHGNVNRIKPGIQMEPKQQSFDSAKRKVWLRQGSQLFHFNMLNQGSQTPKQENYYSVLIMSSAV